jgi:hypothetical protein
MAWFLDNDACNNNSNYQDLQSEIILQMWNLNRSQATLVAQCVLGILFTCVVQGLQTMGLNCAELVVNIHRDEDVWQQLETSRKQRTHTLSTSPFLTALRSLKYDVLYVIKSVLHWLLGQALTPIVISYFGTPSYEFEFRYSRVIVFAFFVIALAVFVTLLTYHCPKRMQPAAWGHLQTLADLTDNWDLDENGRLWWGDKGLGSDGFRNAGTSSSRGGLGIIHEDSLYH